MTFLIIFLAITNMAIGYGLAFYFGKSQKPVQITIGRFRKPKTEANSPPEETFKILPTPEVGNNSSDSNEPNSKDSQEQGVEVEPTPFIAADALAEQEVEKPAAQQVPQLNLSDLMPPLQPAPESAKPAESPQTLSGDELEEVAKQGGAETNDLAEDAEEIDELESLAQQLQTAIVKSSGEEDDDVDSTEEIIDVRAGEGDDAVTVRATSETSPETAPTPGKKHGSAEYLPSGLELFQQQLHQQSVADVGEAARKDLEPEILEGIESFRTQLAQIHTSAPILPRDGNEEL